MFAGFDIPQWFSSLPIGMSKESAYAFAAENVRAYSDGNIERERALLNEIRGCSLALEQVGVIYAGAVLGI
ncbi:hypothetical protein [Streptomyces sedi]|uniref:Uncharacterized protein n=1 Tax=Streptomyces sedi TaxID=555059 RepID=A0A5C4VF33_9ACTN|nr:hypothetical protein [Streptomyces sedi]TNM34382.1 hypothetical protein FH715_01500 [Streptomyces sedi]